MSLNRVRSLNIGKQVKFRVDGFVFELHPGKNTETLINNYNLKIDEKGLKIMD